MKRRNLAEELRLDAAAELEEDRAKERAWREGREATLGELEAGAEMGIARAQEKSDS